MLNWIKDRNNIWIVLNGAAAGVNIALAQLGDMNIFSQFNLLTAGFCIGMVFCLPMINSLRKLVADQSEAITQQTGTIVAQRANIEANSPAHMRTMLQGALTEVVTDMRSSGALPPELEVSLSEHKPPKLLQ